MSLSFQIPWIIFLAAAVLGAAISFFVYRFTVPPVSRAKRYLLTSLRTGAIVLLIFILCEPLLRLSHQSIVPPTVAVLVDNSLSMSLTDDAGNREQQLRSIVSGKPLRQLTSNSTVRFLSFSPSLKELNPDSLQLNGTVTNIASAFSALKKASLPELKAVVLLSDGNYNEGENPLYEAEKFGVPIFSVGIGDSLEQKDIVVEKLLTNSVAYVQSTVPVDATVKVSGFQNRKLDVALLEDGKQIAQNFITLPASMPSGAGEYPVHFSFTPASDGIKKYTVSVSALEGEVTKKNNTRSVLVKILKNKMRVAVIAGAPSADVSAVMQALHADQNIEATLAVQQTTGLFNGHELAQNTSVAAAECLVLVGFPTDDTTPAALETVAHSVSVKATPLFFIASRTLNFQKLKALSTLLPFTTVSDTMDEQIIFSNVLRDQQNHVLSQGNGHDPFDWTKLPPIFSSLSTFKAKPEALVLSTMKIQNVAIDNPLLIARSVMHTKSFAVLGYGLARWKLLASANSETENFFDAWISNAVRWLVTRDDNKQLRVEPSKDFFSQGESVDFVGEVYNANYEPVENADVKLDVALISSQQRYETILNPREQGRYEGAVGALPECDYTFTATATSGASELGKTSGRFSVGEQSLEFADTKMNKTLLEQLSAASGGTYVDGRDVAGLIQKITALPSMKAEERTTTSEFELWNLPGILSVIVALFGVEWFVRKRSGMM